MKKYILVFFFCLPVLMVIAQDVIIKKNGEEIKTKVKTVTDVEIEYTKFDNLEGPSYKIAKTDVLLIIYANGTKDIFSTDTPTSDVKPKTPEAVTRVSQRYYNYDFFDKNVPATFLGIDFSNCKIVSETIDNSPAIFSEINQLFISEENKYDMKAAVRRGKLVYQFGLVDKLNQSINPSSLTENVTQNITFSDLQAIVDKYDLSSVGITDGIAMVMICDNLNGPRKDAAYFYVIFDVVSKKILFSDRLIGRAGGNGQRNYWARTVYETIIAVQDRKFGQWKMMYRR